MFLTFKALNNTTINAVPSAGFAVVPAFVFSAERTNNLVDGIVEVIIALVAVRYNAHIDMWCVHAYGSVTRMDGTTDSIFSHRSAPNYYAPFASFKDALEDANNHQDILSLDLQDILTKWDHPNPPGIIAMMVAVI